MQNHKTQNNGEYRNVSIAILEESPSNPRKRFNEESLKELAESFKSQMRTSYLVLRIRLMACSAVAAQSTFNP